MSTIGRRTCAKYRYPRKINVTCNFAVFVEGVLKNVCVSSKITCMSSKYWNSLHVISEQNMRADDVGRRRLIIVFTILSICITIILYGSIGAAKMKYARVNQWYNSAGDFEGKGFKMIRPTVLVFSLNEILMASEYYAMYIVFGSSLGFTSRLTRKRAQFILFSMADLIERDGFTGIHLCGSSEQLSIKNADTFLGVGLPDNDEKLPKLWNSPQNPWRNLYGNGGSGMLAMLTGFSYKSARKFAASNGGTIASTYLGSLYEGGLVNFALDIIPEVGKHSPQWYMRKLYGGSEIVLHPQCGWKRTNAALNSASGMAMAGFFMGALTAPVLGPWGAIALGGAGMAYGIASADGTC